MSMPDNITPDEENMIVNHMIAKVVDLACKMCKQGFYELENRFYAVAGFMKRKDLYSSIVYACNYCGHLVQFSKAFICGC